MRFDADDLELVSKMSAFFKRAEDEVQRVRIFVDGAELCEVRSFDTDTCDVVVCVRDRSGNLVFNPTTHSATHAVIHANEITIVGKRGWSETYTRNKKFVFTEEPRC